MSRTTYPHPTWSVCTGITEDGRIFYAGRYSVGGESEDGDEWLVPIRGAAGMPAAFARLHARSEGSEGALALVAEKGWP